MARIITPGDVEEIMRKAGISFPPEEEAKPEPVGNAAEGGVNMAEEPAAIGGNGADEPDEDLA
jgi:hypothetical protein